MDHSNDSIYTFNLPEFVENGRLSSCRLTLQEAMLIQRIDPQLSLSENIESLFNHCSELEMTLLPTSLIIVAKSFGAYGLVPVSSCDTGEASFVSRLSRALHNTKAKLDAAGKVAEWEEKYGIKLETIDLKYMWNLLFNDVPCRRVLKKATQQEALETLAKLNLMHEHDDDEKVRSLIMRKLSSDYFEYLPKAKAPRMPSFYN